MTSGSLTGSPSVRALEGMSIVKQRLARWGGPMAIDTSPKAAITDATPPLTPVSDRGGIVSSPELSAREMSCQSTSSMGCELASPRPIRAVISSFLSNHDTGSSYGETPDTRALKIGHAEPEHVSHLDGLPRTLPKHPIFESDNPPISPGPTFITSDGIPIPGQQRVLGVSFGDTAKVRTNTKGLPYTLYDQEVNIDRLRDQISRMHGDVKLAIQQPALPVPQLDDLRDRLEALASGLHSVDIQGLHMKLDQLKDKPQDHTLHNEAPSSSQDIVTRLDVLMSTFHKLRLKIEQDDSLPLIKVKLAAIQEHMEQEVPPPVPDKNQAFDDGGSIREHLKGIQTKVETLENILSTLHQQSEASKVDAAALSIESNQSLSVFRNHGQSINSASQPNPVPPEVSARTHPVGTEKTLLTGCRNPGIYSGGSSGTRGHHHSVRRQR